MPSPHVTHRLEEFTVSVRRDARDGAPARRPPGLLGVDAITRSIRTRHARTQARSRDAVHWTALARRQPPQSPSGETTGFGPRASTKQRPNASKTRTHDHAPAHTRTAVEPRSQFPASIQTPVTPRRRSDDAYWTSQGRDKRQCSFAALPKFVADLRPAPVAEGGDTPPSSSAMRTAR